MDVIKSDILVQSSVLTCSKTLQAAEKITQFSTQEPDLVIVTQAMNLVLVQADKSKLLADLVDDISCLVERYSILGLDLNKDRYVLVTFSIFFWPPDESLFHLSWQLYTCVQKYLPIM